MYQIERLKDDGWITNIQYEDEVLNALILFIKMSGLETNICRCILFWEFELGVAKPFMYVAQKELFGG